MSPLLKNVATVTTLAATALLLIADSEPQVCRRAAEDVTFQVTENTCGRDGTLRIKVGKDACDIAEEVEVSPELGLPDSCGIPDTGALWNGGWTLWGDLYVSETPDGGFEPTDEDGGSHVVRTCESTPGVGGTLRLDCRGGPASTDSTQPAPSLNHTCSAVLTLP